MVIPTLYTTALAVIGVGVSLDEYDLAFYLGYILFAAATIWAICYWLTSDFLTKRRPKVTRSNRHPKYRRYNGWRWSVTAAILLVFGVSIAISCEVQTVKRRSRLVGYLVPATDPMPAMPSQNCPAPPPGSLMVFFGKSVSYATQFPGD